MKIMPNDAWKALSDDVAKRSDDAMKAFKENMKKQLEESSKSVEEIMKSLTMTPEERDRLLRRFLDVVTRLSLNDFYDALCVLFDAEKRAFSITIDTEEEDGVLYWEVYDGLPSVDITRPNKGVFIASGRVTVARGDDGAEVFLDGGNYDEDY